QVLLEEMARSKDIVFATVIMPDGTILAHSDGVRTGDLLQIHGNDATEESIAALNPSIETQWHFMTLEGKRVFAVYRFFTPGFRTIPRGLVLPIIIIGLDPSPFEMTRRQNTLSISLLAGCSFLIALASFAALFFAKRARESEEKQEKAEGLVRQLEEEMRRKEKLAAIGSLAAGVAHEIRNPLSSIKGYATYFSQRFPQGSDDQASCLIMVNEVNRLNRVITDLIGLSKPSDIVPALHAPQDLVEGVVRLIREDAKNRNVILRVRFSSNLSSFFFDQERMHQALLNLCLNALDAMPKGGTLTLGAFAKQKRLYFLVKDTGCGIAKEHLSHIFDPYFTTHTTGTGLGLALVHKIVDAHHGFISVRSKKADNGSGWTLFYISLDSDLAGEERASQDITC
ncbi:MAG: two-component system sensor histidine kinase ZraS, partial [Desulfovibrio sp.]|nr:two-component system sensor histidine kinase ZraS [Desulfovibrio sp.]